MVKVTFSTGRYIVDLTKRMKRIGLSQAGLAAELDPPISPTQMTRYFTENEDRRRQPSLDTIERIEIAMDRLERKHERRMTKTGGTSMKE